MEYKLPFEMHTSDGNIIMNNKLITGYNKGGIVERNVDQIRNEWGNKIVDIIIIVHNRPDAFVKCIESILNKSNVEWLNKNIIVVDNCSDKFTKTVINKYWIKNLIDDCIELDDYRGYLPALYVGAKETEGNWIVFVDQNIIVTDNWLLNIVGTITSEKRVGMVIPWTSKRLPYPHGSNYNDTSRRLQNVKHVLQHEVALPAMFCVAVNRKAFKSANGFNMVYSPGYGEFADLYMVMRQNSYKTLRCDDSYVMDKTDGYSDSSEWYPDKIVGHKRFMKKWDRLITSTIRKKAFGDVEEAEIVAKQIINNRKMCDKEVVFLFNEAPICGLVLAAVYICNHLIANGYKASFACTRLEKKDWQRLSLDFTPYIFKHGQDLINGLSHVIGPNAHVIATTWITVDNAVAIKSRRNDVKLHYYIQDDEREFKYPSGELYANKNDIENSYKKIDNLVVNSNWVGKILERIGLQSHKIPIGVDSLLFYPTEKESGKVRIMAHSRPSTPRRGWEFICEIMNIVSRNSNVEFVTYGDEPTGINIRHHSHLGMIGHDKLALQMGKVDIFIEGSKIQGWGMQALEAMSCACALICTDNKGIHSFGKHDNDCVIIKHGDVTQGVKVAEELIGNKDKIQRLGNKARKTSEKFGWDKVVKYWVRYLE